jgi:hypothetical protein
MRVQEKSEFPGNAGFRCTGCPMIGYIVALHNKYVGIYCLRKCMEM